MDLNEIQYGELFLHRMTFFFGRKKIEFTIRNFGCDFDFFFCQTKKCPTSTSGDNHDTPKTVFSPLASHISYGRVTMRIFYYINRSAILFYSYYVHEALSQSFVVKSYGANKSVC